MNLTYTGLLMFTLLLGVTMWSQSANSDCGSFFKMLPISNSTNTRNTQSQYRSTISIQSSSRGRGHSRVSTTIENTPVYSATRCISNLLYSQPVSGALSAFSSVLLYTSRPLPNKIKSLLNNSIRLI